MAGILCRRLCAAMLVGVALILITSAVTQAASLPTPEAARKLTDSFISKSAVNDIDGGLALLKPYMLVSSAEFDSAVEKIKLTYPIIMQRFGKPVGHDFIQEKRLGASYIRIIQLQKFERDALPWTFIFYKASDSWALETFFMNNPKIFDLMRN